MESPYKEIFLFVFGGGLITAVIAASKEIRERVAEKKKQKAAADDLHLSNAVERQRLDNESESAAWQRNLEMLERSQREEQRLRLEIEQLRGASSMSSLTVTQWYKCYRELGRKIDKHETQIAREIPHRELADSLLDLRRKYDELGEKMP